MLLATLETAYNAESVHVYFPRLIRAQVPFRDREKRSSEVIPLRTDTQPQCKDEYARLPG